MFDWARHRNLIFAFVILLLIVLGLYLNMRGRKRWVGAMAVVQCVDLYAQAATAAETTAVDAVHPIQRLTEETTCLTLRMEGRLDR